MGPAMASRSTEILDPIPGTWSPRDEPGDPVKRKKATILPVHHVLCSLSFFLGTMSRDIGTVSRDWLGRVLTKKVQPADFRGSLPPTWPPHMVWMATSQCHAKETCFQGTEQAWPMTQLMHPWTTLCDVSFYLALILYSLWHIHHDIHLARDWDQNSFSTLGLPYHVIRSFLIQTSSSHICNSGKNMSERSCAAISSWQLRHVCFP